MANSLHRVINENDRVVVNGRVFICSGRGFGTKPYLSGSAVFGRWEDTNKEDRIEGFEIDRESTDALAK